MSQPQIRGKGNTELALPKEKSELLKQKYRITWLSETNRTTNGSLAYKVISMKKNIGNSNNNKRA